MIPGVSIPIAAIPGTAVAIPVVPAPGIVLVVPVAVTGIVFPVLIGMEVVVQLEHPVPVAVVGRRHQEPVPLVHCLQAIFYRIIVVRFHLIRTVLPGLRDQVAILIVGIGDGGDAPYKKKQLQAHT